MTPEDLVDKAGDLGSPPTVLKQLMAVMKRQSSSAADMAEVIATDGPLSARLLKLANSALFGLSEEIDRIDRAVTLIGTRQLQALAMATSVIDAFRDVDLGTFSADAFWRHSLGVAVSARAIGEHCRAANPEQLFLVGVLHDIGRLVMLVAAPETVSRAIARAHKQKHTVLHFEQSEFGFDHTQVGKALIESWKLPSTVSQPVIRHHAPGANRDSCIVHLADAFTHGLGFGASGEHIIPPLQDSAWDLTELTPKYIKQVVERVSKEYPVVIEHLLGPTPEPAAAGK